MKKIKEKIRTIPHFPKEGIMFRDITTIKMMLNKYTIQLTSLPLPQNSLITG